MRESLLILIGGDETTRHVISGGVHQLLADRSRWERLLADRSLVPSAVVALTTDGLVDGDCDPSGAFRFDELPRRPFCLVVTAPGRSVKTGWVVA